MPGAQFAGALCQNHLTLRSHYHTTASRDNVLVYTVAGAVAVVAAVVAVVMVFAVVAAAAVVLNSNI